MQAAIENVTAFSELASAFSCLSARKKMNCQLQHLECQTDYIGVLTIG